MLQRVDLQTYHLLTLLCSNRPHVPMSSANADSSSSLISQSEPSDGALKTSPSADPVLPRRKVLRLAGGSLQDRCSASSSSSTSLSTCGFLSDTPEATDMDMGHVTDSITANNNNNNDNNTSSNTNNSNDMAAVGQNEINFEMKDEAAFSSAAETCPSERRCHSEEIDVQIDILRDTEPNDDTLLSSAAVSTSTGAQKEAFCPCSVREAECNTATPVLPASDSNAYSEPVDTITDEPIKLQVRGALFRTIRLTSSDQA